MTKYIAVRWPIYQIFMNHPRFKEECYFCCDPATYFVPEDLYNEIYTKLQNAKEPVTITVSNNYLGDWD